MMWELWVEYVISLATEPYPARPGGCRAPE